jgi:hypothetical protein
LQHRLRTPQFEERLGAVTTAAVRSEPPEVRIVAPVTLRAGSGRRAEFSCGTSVTLRTREIIVGAGQCKVRLQVVVENPRTPVGRVVAGVALLAEMAVMHVFFDVTVVAFGARVVKREGGMTAAARRCRMPAEQRKRSEVVIERDAAPREFRVTIRALRAELSLMRILRVAGRTLASQ